MMNRIKICLLILLIPFFIIAQNNELDWLDVKPFKLFYKLQEKDVPLLLNSKTDEKSMQSFLHTPVDSMQEPGQYLHVIIKENRVLYEHHQIVPYHIHHFKEYGALCFQITDKQGNIREDATVEIFTSKNKPLIFDKQTLTYRIEENKLSPQEKIRFSLDGYDAWFSMGKIYNYGYNTHSPRTREIYSYMLTDKNKYKPGETVRFKAYAVSDERIPLTDSVEVWLNPSYYSIKPIKIKTIRPYNPGGYAGDIYLHDSLQLRLDRYYYIQLKTPKGKIVASTKFDYKDYELSKTELKITQKTSYHTTSGENEINIHLTDANGLFIPDAKATITIRLHHIGYSHVPLLSLPDTLLHQEIRLESHKATVFTIPNSLFKESRLTYITEVTVETLEGFMESRRFNSTFSYDPGFIALDTVAIKQDISFHCQNGNLEITYTENHIPLVCKALITCDGKDEKIVFLPHKEPLKQYAGEYEVKIPDKNISGRKRLADIHPTFNIKARHTAKTIELELENPQGIDVNWYIYNGDKLQDKGFGKELKKTYPILNPEAVYTVELFYRTGNREQTFRRDIKPPVQHFSIEHNLPERIYPGQQVETTILITDPDGQPVEGVDLTALAYNSTLDYILPDLDIEKRTYTYRPFKGGFEQYQNIIQVNNKLDYDFWRPIVQLDTLRYYRFTHPKHTLQTYTIETPDSTTQFAPFILWKGEFYLPHVIECDGIPLWFSWTDYPDTYAFYISPDTLHTIDLYVGKEKITLKDVTFNTGVKTIFSVDPQYLPGEKEENKEFSLNWYSLTDEILRQYQPYTSSYLVPGRMQQSYLRQDEKYYKLATYTYTPYPRTLGPLPEGEYSFSDSTIFQLQGSYLYELNGKKVNKRTTVKTFSNSQNISTSSYIIKRNMEATCYHPEKYKKSLPVTKTPYTYKKRDYLIENEDEKIKIHLHLPDRKETPGISRIILYNKQNGPEEYTYFRDFPKHITLKDFTGIQKEEYALFILYEDSSYLFTESIFLQRNHTLLLSFQQKDILQSDLISEKLLNFPVIVSEEPYILEYIPPVIEEYEEESANYIFSMVERDPGYDSFSEYDKDTSDKKEDAIYEEIKQLQRIRSNFSDVAFWQAQLVTDKKGSAQFTVTFPDNITRWNSIIYAANPTLMTGTARHSIRSFNPIMAELGVPRFLVDGDSCIVNGLVRNHMENEHMCGKSQFIIQSDSLQETSLHFSGSHREHQFVIPQDTDSLTTTYLFTREDGYMDGEQHTIPVKRQGTEITEGFIKLLSAEENLILQAQPGEQVHVRLSSSELDIYLDAMSFLRGYEYACNEQLASKLKGILSFRLYTLSQGQEFLYDKEVNAIIQRLVKNQNSQSLWAWWNNSHEHSGWMSGHIMEALYEARKAGYKFDLKYKPGIRFRDIIPENVEWLCMLPKLYGGYEWLQKKLEELLNFNSGKDLSLKQQLLIYEFLQTHTQQWNPEVMKKYLHKHPSGTMYCSDNKRYNWYNDELITTAIAYRIIEKENSLQDYKEPLRAFLINSQQKKWNTYQASVILSAILPGFIKEPGKEQIKNTAYLKGLINQEINVFPYELTLQPGEELQVSKTGTSPLFCSAHSHRETTNAVTTSEFSIRTAFDKGDTLTIGQPVILHVYVTIHEPRAEHVMIEITIPAGCSYDQTRYSYSHYETYRESYKDKTVIFAKQLNKGEYHYTIRLQPRFKGEFHMNPGKISLMYFPHVCGTTDMQKIRIE